MTPALDDRLVPFEACFNFRDLGGYLTADGRRVRWNQIYRADTLHRLTSADIATFNDLGLSTVIDLRAPDEIAENGGLPAAVTGVEWHNHPLIPSMKLRLDQSVATGEEAADTAPGQGYLEFVGDGSAAVAVLETVARSSDASVFHCTAGKDRTGVIAAMLLDLLGVDDDTIAADYLLTAQTRKRSGRWIAENEPEFAAFLATIPLERRVVDPAAILGFLARLRAEHDSVEAFVSRRGLDTAALEALRTRLVD